MNLHLFVLTLLLRLGQSLIGLRPPSADPTFRKHQLQRATHHNIAQQAVRHYTEKELNHTQKSIANFLMQRFHKKFFLKKDVYNKLKKLDVTDTNNGKSSFNRTNEFTDERRCNHYSTLKCSIRFLKSVIRDKDLNCQSLKRISSCLCPYCVSDECSARKSLHTIAHDRECYLDKQIQLTVTKGTVYCCEDELLKCTIDTYISMTESEPSCDSISEFTACTAGLTSALSNLKFDRVFHLLLSLSKTCISSLKLYL